jgi:hypothetical protein
VTVNSKKNALKTLVPILFKNSASEHRRFTCSSLLAGQPHCRVNMNRIKIKLGTGKIFLKRIDKVKSKPVSNFDLLDILCRMAISQFLGKVQNIKNLSKNFNSARRHSI